MKKKGGGERRGGGDRKRKREEKGQRGRQRARKKKRKRKSFFVLFEREGERGERPERETERGSEWKREREKERIVFFMRERAVQERKNRTLVGHEWVDYVLNPKLCPISNFSSKTHGRRPISHKIRKTEKKVDWRSVGALVRPLWRAAAPELKPLRLPRARIGR